MKETPTGLPTANIAINKNRIKSYMSDKDNNQRAYYLADQTEFQIELFNPTPLKVLAKIFLNGQSISNGGLILKPGERIFLERYLDKPNKFKFETYQVSNSNEVKKAIINNGDVKIEFYSERIFHYYPTYTYFNTSQLIGGNGVLNANLDNSTYTYISPDMTFTPTSVTSNYSGNIGLQKKDIETGRIESGSNSNQKLIDAEGEFDFFPSRIIKCKLLPISEKINTSSDIKVKKYCATCGSKLGKTDKFCSQCGAKVN